MQLSRHHELALSHATAFILNTAIICSEEGIVYLAVVYCFKPLLWPKCSKLPKSFFPQSFFWVPVGLGQRRSCDPQTSGPVKRLGYWTPLRRAETGTGGHLASASIPPRLMLMSLSMLGQAYTFQ